MTSHPDRRATLCAIRMRGHGGWRYICCDRTQRASAQLLGHWFRFVVNSPIVDPASSQDPSDARAYIPSFIPAWDRRRIVKSRSRLRRSGRSLKSEALRAQTVNPRSILGQEVAARNAVTRERDTVIAVMEHDALPAGSARWFDAVIAVMSDHNPLAMAPRKKNQLWRKFTSPFRRGRPRSQSR